jgi:hypothetical protein
MVTVTSPDLLKEGQYPYLQNTRKLLGGRISARPPLGDNLIPSPLPSGATSLTRLNDPYAASPYYVRIVGAAGVMYVESTSRATGLSGNPLSFLPYRPSQSPQPWCYVGDPSLTVSIPSYIASGYGLVAGMLKVRSNGTVYKTGIKEPQVAPAIVASTVQGVISVTIVSPGSGQTPGTYSIPSVGGGGTGATVQIVISSGGAITSAAVTNAGSGYTSAPSFPVSEGGTPGVLLATIGAVGPNWVTYRYDYRSSVTGAVSNPSPESPPQIIPQTSVSGSEVAATSSVINANITVNSSQYEGNGSQIRTTGSVTPGTVTDYIVARNFGIAVPTGVNVDGVLAATNWLGQYAGTGVITSVALFYQGSILGQVKSPGITNQQSSTTSTQGGNSDNWGTVLTPAIVNDSTFGIGFQVTAQESSGSDRSFFNNFSITVYYTTLSASVTATPSLDPQVDTIDYYRMDPGLNNFTYIGSTANVSTGFSDTQSDLAVAGNPILSFANYEPFPSIDLPRKGICTVTATTVPGTLNVTAGTGDTFNVRWLPGNIINIAGIAYTLYSRPSSTTQLCAVTTAKSDTGFLSYGFPPAAANVPWFITVPTLAAEPSPVIWGPTPDNAGSFYFGLDPNNQGDLLWSMGNNFDSAPDTNRLYVTSPNEPLMNGTVTSELSTVFSTDRFWLIYPNFADAVAAVTGTLGSQWTLVQSASSRGLYMRYAIAALGAETGWRAKDGIFMSLGGGPEKEISTQIYNLFPHSGQLPQPVVIGGDTVYPPDDTKPNAQTMTLTPGYLFYNYQDTTGTPRTLVYDKEVKGWSVDAYTPTVNCHAWVTGAVNQTLVGCTDGTVRALDSAGTETGAATVATPCINGGSPRTVKRIGGVFLRALAAIGIGAQFWKNRYTTQITGTSPSTTATSAGETDYLFDFTGATGADCLDLAAVFSFPLSSGNWLKEWQPDWTSIPEQIVAWRTGMLSYGLDGWLHIPWLRFAYSSTTSISLSLITDQGVTIALTIPSSGGTPAKFFTWLPANVSGASTKFKMLEWVADAGGSAWTCYGADMECAIKAWGSTSGYKTIKPFRKTDGSST